MLFALGLLIVLVIIGLIIYARWEYGVFEKMGLPVVKHHPILGSIREIYTTVGGLNDVKLMQKYGKIFGVS